MVITGAGRGIGQAAALRFAREGSLLVLNDVDEKPLRETVEQLPQQGGSVVSVVGSVTDPSLAGRLVQATVDTYGDLHVAVTCAGFTWDAMLHRMTDEQWQTILDVHLTGTFRMVREAIRVMRERAREEREGGNPPTARKITTIASLSAYGNVGQTNYSAAKAGIIGLTRSVALEGASFNILANSLAFRVVDTRLTQERGPGETIGDTVPLGIPREQRQQLVQRIPLQRPATVEEAAGPLVFLACDDANYITGQVLDVNGGTGI